MIEIVELKIPAVKVIKSKRYIDERGYFSESFNRRELASFGIDLEFVQDNHSYSKFAATVRGLHFQSPPDEQKKLVRVLRGSIFDVAVDLRVGSQTYGHYVAVTLNSENGKQLLVPEDFAHGFMTLEDNTEVLYKTTSYYSPNNDFGIYWKDPDVGIPWPLSEKKVILSNKDKILPTLAKIISPFKIEI